MIVYAVETKDGCYYVAASSKVDAMLALVSDMSWSFGEENDLGTWRGSARDLAENFISCREATPEEMNTIILDEEGLGGRTLHKLFAGTEIKYGGEVLAYPSTL